MRILPILACIAFAAPAFAQKLVCEGSHEGDAGEVIASYELDRATGDVQMLTISWTPVRSESAGVESQFFARPGLLLDYRLSDEGKLAGPTRASVLITSVASSGGRQPPSRADMQMRATAPGEPPILWPATKQTEGEKQLAAMIKDKAPSSVTTDLVAKDGKVLASAEFDFSKTVEMEKSLAAAKAKGEKRVEAYKKAVADGMPPQRCPR